MIEGRNVRSRPCYLKSRMSSPGLAARDPGLSFRFPFVVLKVKPLK